ncbi:MAG: hypothetical protein AVDCRST_MAG73-384 [uncultured Thermomicrobiales bacterium]|uniref:Uncharacterized protein n=1 Tax=uncultured Thermomicrobiales bacterium TaxID=1645740 RepID=A0A6J4TIX8_9BACT|nr:MAG: hypothetical protein AVDCRST_MAG73-384 [uncultured Thermomicrobiales bacterium]
MRKGNDAKLPLGTRSTNPGDSQADNRLALFWDHDLAALATFLSAVPGQSASA